MTPCPDDQILLQILKGDTANEPGQQIDSHVGKCPDCQRRMKNLALCSKDRAPAAALPPAHYPQPLPDLPGYEVLEELDPGGMGVVYKARHCALNRIVALKMIRSGPNADPQELRRFRAEAEAVARVQHPHIIQIFEVGEHAGQPFLSLEYMEGGSLKKKLAGMPQPPREAAQLVETLARAIHVAHEQGIIHRDLKPANVLLTKDGTPKIADFGLVKRLDIDVQQTQTGAIIGTPSYMAPEQADGRTKEIGQLADVYALGAILYKLLTGRPPFPGTGLQETLDQVRNQDPVPVRRLQPQVPHDLETICLKCLEKEPARRYGTALALADDLRRWLNREPILARPVGSLERTWKWAKRRPAGAALAVVGVLAAVALVSVITTAATIVYGKNQQLEWSNNHLEEANFNLAQANEELVIKRNRARAAQEEAENMLLDGLLRPSGHGGLDLNEMEKQALSEVARLPNNRIRLRFLERGLENPETAELISRRSRPVLEAVVGQDAGLRAQVRDVLRSRLQYKGLDPRISVACIRFQLKLGEIEPTCAREAAGVLIESMGRTSDPSVLLALGQLLNDLAGKMDAEGAKETAPKILDVMGQITDSLTLLALVKAVGALVSKMDASGADPLRVQAIPKVLDMMGRTADLHAFLELATTFHDLAQNIDAAGAKESAFTILDAMDQTADPSVLKLMAHVIQFLAESMDASGARETASRILKVMGRVKTLGYDDSMMVEVLSTLARKMDKGEATELAIQAAAKILEAMSRTSRTIQLDDLAEKILVQADKLGEPVATELRRQAVHRVEAMMDRATDGFDIAKLARIVGTLTEKMDAAEAARLMRQPASKTLVAMNQSTGNLVPLAQAVSTLAKKMDPAGAEAAAAEVMKAMNRRPDPYALSALAQAIGVLASRIDSAGAAQLKRQAAASVLDTMGRSTDILALSVQARIVSTLTENMDTIEAAEFTRQATSRLLTELDQTTAPLELLWLAQAIGALSRRMDAVVTKEVAIKVSKAMNRTTDPEAVSNLTWAVRTLAKRMDTTGTRETVVKVLEAMERTPDQDTFDNLSDSFGALAEWVNRADLVALLTSRNFPPRIADALLRELEPLACQQFSSIDEAVKCFCLAGGP